MRIRHVNSRVRRHRTPVAHQSVDGVLVYEFRAALAREPAYDIVNAIPVQADLNDQMSRDQLIEEPADPSDRTVADGGRTLKAERR